MVYIEGQELEDINYTVDFLEKGEYELCTFLRCDFSKCDLSSFKFIETRFIDCNLSNCKLQETSFQEVEFNNCKMLGLHFDACNTFNFDVQFEMCVLSHSTFYKMRLLRSSFSNCKLEGVDFTEANLKGRKLVHCDLINATFERTNLENSDLRESLNYTFDPEINFIKGAKFSQDAVLGLLKKYRIIVE